MRMRYVCLLLTLSTLSGCRSVSEFLFPPDSPDMGPPYYGTWERERGLEQDEVLYMGDDFPDLKCIVWAGVGATPANARQEVRERADYVTDASGGHGAVREIAEQILIAKGMWAAIVESFLG